MNDDLDRAAIRARDRYFEERGLPLPGSGDAYVRIRPEVDPAWHEGWQAGVADCSEGVLWIVAPIVMLTFVAGVLCGWWLL